MNGRAVVLHSGGMDSSTLLYYLLSQDYECRTLSVNYGQRHDKELHAAQRIAQEAGVEHKIIYLPQLSYFLGGSALTSPDVEVPEGLYDEESMAITVVPNRNMILFSIAGGYADSLGYDLVAGAQHAGDHAVYPDCRPDFIYAADIALRKATENRVGIITPFVSVDKAHIAQTGRHVGVPFELTWSCYKGGDLHCGTCGTCTERIEAIWNAGFVDPTEYEPGAYELTLELLRQAGKVESE